MMLRGPSWTLGQIPDMSMPLQNLLRTQIRLPNGPMWNLCRVPAAGKALTAMTAHVLLMRTLEL